MFYGQNGINLCQNMFLSDVGRFCGLPIWKMFQKLLTSITSASTENIFFKAKPHSVITAIDFFPLEKPSESTVGHP